MNDAAIIATPFARPDTVTPGPQRWARTVGEVPPTFVTLTQDGETYVLAQEFAIRSGVTGEITYRLEPVPGAHMPVIDFSDPH